MEVHDDAEVSRDLTGRTTEAPRARSSAHVVSRGLRLGAYALCVGLFAHVLVTANLRAAWTRIEAVGPLALILLFPFPLGLLSDAWAWARLLETLGTKVSVLRIFQVRLVTEAMTNSAPGGAVWADAFGPILLSQQTGIGTADAYASSTAKRWLVVRTHGAYVTVAAALGAPYIIEASRPLVGHEGLLVFVLVGAAILALVSIGIETLAARGNVATRLSRRLTGTTPNATLARIQAWIETRQHHFAHADKQLTKLSTDPRASMVAAGRLALLWFFEGFETFLIFRLLGADLTFIEVISFDAALSVVRSSAVFAPAGIGIQDMGYLAILGAYGVPDAASIGPAFVVLKRLKEVVYVVVGFSVFAAFRRRRRRVGEQDEAKATLANALPGDELVPRTHEHGRPERGEGDGATNGEARAP